MKGMYDGLFFNSMLVCWGRKGSKCTRNCTWLPMMVFMVLYFVGKKCVGKFVFFKYMYVIADK